MTAFATQADMIAAFGTEQLIQLTDRTGAGVIAAEVLAFALTAAQAEVEGYVRSRYDLPLPSVPPLLTQLTIDLARYRLVDQAPSAEMRQRYEDVIGRLKDVARGLIKLDVGGAEAPAAPDAVHVVSSERLFSRGEMKGY